MNQLSAVRCCGGLPRSPVMSKSSLRFSRESSPVKDAVAEAVRYFQDDFFSVPLTKLSVTPVPPLGDNNYGILPQPYPNVTFQRGDETFSLKFFTSFIKGTLQYDLRNKDNSVIVSIVRRPSGHDGVEHFLTALVINGHTVAGKQSGDDTAPLMDVPLKVLTALGVSTEPTTGVVAETPKD